MSDICNDSQLKEFLIDIGFNFSLIGTTYLKEALQLVLEQPKLLLSLNTTVLNQIAIKNSCSIKNIEANIKWTIINAYNKGMIKKIYTSPNNKIPTTKQMVVLLFDFIMD